LKLTFWIVYDFLFLWTLLLYLGVIWRPQLIRKTLMKIFKFKLLRRWEGGIDSLTQNMISTSAELKSKPFKFWMEVFGATALSWTSRYLVVNALFLGFLSSADPWQWVILARQFVIWVVLMVSPTPGGSGLSEWLFSEYYGDIVTSAGLALVMAVLWRIISYYVYLIIGAVIVPGWVKNSVKNISVKDKKTVS
ncbi:MAG: flippase-like domain-containing protein, partial [Muribaculaceae bacterium]|nr:flippase-like domain-containing protein [Muribaculaceae bacterium]